MIPIRVVQNVMWAKMPRKSPLSASPGYDQSRTIANDADHDKCGDYHIIASPESDVLIFTRIGRLSPGAFEH